MPVWPLPEHPERSVPLPGDPGGFGEDRGDRRHCGIDLYAPAGSPVAAMAPGTVVETGPFTQPETNAYWKATRYVLVRHGPERFLRYAELEEVFVRAGETVEAGQPLGTVGTVLAPADAEAEVPSYIRRLQDEETRSMLHLEMLRTPPEPTDRYAGGNHFDPVLPESLLDPTPYLLEAAGH